jgi:hypothetical protein
MLSFANDQRPFIQQDKFDRPEARSKKRERERESAGHQIKNESFSSCMYAVK